MKIRLSPAIALCALAIGCANSSHLPTYSDSLSARKILADRAAAVHTLSATCGLKLIRADGQSIHLDALMVMSPPDNLRLRAWKMSQAVFDLTIRPDGVWIESSAKSSPNDATLPATADMARHLLWITGDYFRGGDLVDMPSSDPNVLQFRRDLPGGGAMICQVDRPTLTPREFRIVDATGSTHFTMQMSQYRDFNGIAWPTHLIATSPDRSRIEISLSDPEFNAELAPQAFAPPAGAEKQP